MAGLTCPRCHGALVDVRTRSVSMLGCASCGGVWLDNGSTRRVIDALCDDTVDKAEALSRIAQVPADRHHGLACPSCTAPLGRWSVPEANVDVDWCEHHGTWFDRDELATVARTYAARRAYGGGGRALAVGAGAAAVGAGALTAGAIAQDPGMQERAQRAIEGVDGETVIDGAEIALEVGANAGDLADGASAVAEGAGSLFGAFGDILGGL